jgi:uncharacterized phage-associated protein
MVNMRFVFDERKTAQAAAFFAKEAGGKINYMKLIKLLYLADRQALIETGAPLTGDKWVAMDHGPVLSQVLDLINYGGSEIGWNEFIEPPVTYQVSLKKDPEMDELSELEVEILRSVNSRFGAMKPWALVDLTHRLPEWSDPRHSALPIEPEEVLRLAGKSSTEIAAIAAQAEAIWYVRSIA